MKSNYQKALEAINTGSLDMALRSLIDELRKKDEQLEALIQKLDSDTGVSETDYEVEIKAKE